MTPDPSNITAIIGSGLPEQLGDAGDAVFSGVGGIAWGARWRRQGGRLLIDLDPSPLATQAALATDPVDPTP